MTPDIKNSRLNLEEVEDYLDQTQSDEKALKLFKRKLLRTL